MRILDLSLTAHETSRENLPFVDRFIVTGVTWEIASNCEEVLSMMADISGSAKKECPSPDLILSVYVDPTLPDRDTRFPPYFRALEHLYFGTFGAGDSFLVDQRRRRLVASMCLTTSRDVNYWKRVILPCWAGITSACVGVTPLHCACVAKDQFGLLIHGESGSGKSTLALTLSLIGFSYLSDDCTYLSGSERQIQCWGSSAPLKLLPDAVAYFPELAELDPSESLNGELAFQVDPAATFGVQRSSNCAPRWVLFMEKDLNSTPTFRRVDSAEAADRLASDLERLPLCVSDQRNRQLAMIQALAERGGWMLRHDLPPEALARTILQFCSNN
jgi:hypothetical protein